MMAQLFSALLAPAEDLRLVPSTHMAVNNHLQFHGCTDLHAGKTLRYRKLKSK